ncbi:hypothetical protein IQ257_27570, partial [Coleofasciculus sp. LEGE 07092]|nr:hypothetical protein [Coleofasciculus sp. LEGE 07092]
MSPPSPFPFFTPFLDTIASQDLLRSESLMFHLPDNHPILKGSRLWFIALVSVSLLVPWLLAQSLPPRSEPAPSSPQQSPQPLPPSPSPQPLNPWSAEQEWHHKLLRQSLAWQPPQA